MAKAEAKKEVKPKAAAKSPKKVAKKEKPAKKEKKVKDPNAPKRPLSAYMYFSADKRGAIKDKNPSFGVADIAKELGAMWKTMTDKDKTKYNDQAAKDKVRYEKEKAKYTK
ncbi:MAG: high mobility group box domain-containing protein [Monoraphidium minutum]|nr:MAG: high mobility group box domain-containing protein [Monoraphidium minutum]KAI8468563.1 MAG: high mobility group box domain-containing protein [Monoraphidium minutum]